MQKNDFERFGIPPQFVEWVKRSWENDEHTIMGRYDLAVRPDGGIKLLEYNADTPTALLEAAVIQWFWMKELFPTRDQFNNIHERLIEGWLSVAKKYRERWYFASVSADDSAEDFMTVNYLRDTAIQAQIETDWIAVADIGYNRPRATFVDMQDRPIQNCFKLYPWEWMVREGFGPQLIQTAVNWLEAPWKMILSNKAILAVLWEMFPDNEFLLEASFEPLAGDFVRQADLLARRRQHPDRPRRQAHREHAGRLQRAVCLPAPHRPPQLRWQLPGHRLVDGQRFCVRHRHPRGPHAGHRQPLAVRAAFVLISNFERNPHATTQGPRRRHCRLGHSHVRARTSRHDHFRLSGHCDAAAGVCDF